MPIEASKRATSQKPGTQVVRIETHSRVEFRDVTQALQKLIEESGAENGCCHVFIPHTTAALLVNENDDPDLQRDFEEFLNKVAPRGQDYHHNDGNCDAHLKAGIIGATKTLLFESRRLLLGRWQGVFFCEFDGPRRREMRVKIVSD